MMTLEGRPKILDFGLAKLVDAFGDEAVTATETESAELTRRGQVLGTVAYMSPEQAQGKPVDSRSDIFSFGVMLYELAAGERPFRGDTPTSTIAKILETEPKPLGEIRGDLPGELLRIVRRCLRKKPEERFQSTGDLVVALKELRQETASGPTQGWSDAIPVGGGRSRKVVAVALSALILVVAVSAAIVKLTRQRPAPKPEPVLKQITSNASENAVLDASISPDGKYLAFADPTGTYLRVIETGENHRLVSHETLGVERVAWFPDGTRLALTAFNEEKEGGSAWAISILGGAPRKLRDNALIGSVSPDGSLISLLDFGLKGGSGEAGIWVMGPDGENARKLVPGVPGEWLMSAGSWSPDSGKLVFVRGSSSAGAFKASLEITGRDGGPTTVVHSDPNLGTLQGSYPSWMPDGRILYSLAEPSPNQTSANLWEIATDPRTGTATGEPRRLTSFPDSMVVWSSVTRDGKRVAFLKRRQQADVYLGDLQAGATRLDNVRRLTLDERDDHPSGWTRDSKSLYFSSNRQGTPDIYRQGAEDRTAEVVIGGPGREAGAELSPDGSCLLYVTRPPASESSPARVMRIPVAGGPPEVVVEQKHLLGFDCPRAPGASCILLLYQDGKISFFAFDPLKGRQREIGEAHPAQPVWSVSPDGARIAFVTGLSPGAPTEKLRIKTMSVADGTTHEFRAEGLSDPTDVSWSADGKGLFVIDNSAVGRRLLRFDLEGHVSVLRQSASGYGLIDHPIPSPDGRYLAFEEFTQESNAWIMENF